MARRTHVVVSAMGFLAAGCTFTGLADYDIPLCDPTLPIAQDPCNALNNGATGCVLFQCNAATKRCVRGTLDADRDGDPPPQCGGHDCDDNDANRSSIGTEICDGIDNDCDELTDNGLLFASPNLVSTTALSDVSPTDPDLAFSADDGTDTYASYSGVAPTCVHGFSLDGTNQESDGGCIYVGSPTGSAPHARQARIRPVGLTSSSALGVAFVDQASTTCGKEQLAFANSLSAAPSAGDCGASLPTLASFSSQSEAVIAYYDASLAMRVDPIDGCAAITPASLRVRYVDNPASTSPNLTTSAATTVGQASAASSTRPPALLPIPGGTSLLLASPMGANAALYALTANGTVVPLAPTIGDLANARSVAMAVGSDGTTTRVAIVAEQGCKPSQSITLVIGKLDPLGPSLTGKAGALLSPVTIVPAGAALATAPSVGWIAGRNEWWVTWEDDRQKVSLVRVTANGSKVDAKITVKSGATISSVRSDSHNIGLDAGASSGASIFVMSASTSIDEVNVTCRGQ